jgi:pyruvyl transferase EpsO
MMAPAASNAVLGVTAAAPSVAAGRGAAAMQRLKERLAGLQRLLPPGRPVLYLDYPVHLNVGDQLINLGTECYLKDHGHRVIGRYSLFNCPAGIARRIPGDAVVLLNGGGNLGDVYVDHEAFRQRIVAEHPGHRIVILPQTIHFTSAGARAAAAAVYGRHPDLTICVRDGRSAEAATGLGAASLLLPDMAHQLWRHPALHRLRGPVAQGEGRLRFFRKDGEATESTASAGASFDWADWQGAAAALGFRALRKLHYLAPRLRGSLGLAGLWYRFRDALIAGALRRMGNPAAVETDRLHMSILATLLGIPVVLFDNAYGKNAGYAAAWFAGHDGVCYRGRRQP